MKQQVQATTQIETNGEWCGECRFGKYIFLGDQGRVCDLFGCRLDHVLVVVEVDDERWTHYEDRRCAACLVATGEHMLMTNTQYAAWLVAEQGYREVPGADGGTVLTRTRNKKEGTVDETP